jgi:hypothetical protein
VNEPKNAVIRDLAITTTGIVSRNIQPEKQKSDKPRRQLSSQQTPSAGQPAANEQRSVKPPQHPAPTPDAVPSPQPWTEPPAAPR